MPAAHVMNGTAKAPPNTLPFANFAPAPVAAAADADAVAVLAPNAPITANVKTAVGVVLRSTLPSVRSIRSANMTRPRESRCFTASSETPSTSATEATDLFWR